MGTCMDPNVVTKTYGYSAVDLPVALAIYYTGPLAWGGVDVAATTGDLTFKSGATSGTATTTTETGPVLPVGGTAGIIDASDSEADTLYKIMKAIQLSDVWDCKLIDELPTEATEISAGNAMYLTAYSTGNDATVDGGFEIKTDTSLKTVDGTFSVGVTFNAQPSDIHPIDIGVLHEVFELEANITYGGTTGGIYVYECNDLDGTKVQIDHLPLTSATLTYFPTGGANDYPMWATKGRRIVFQALDIHASAGAITVPTLLARTRSLAYTPVSRRPTWADKSI